MCIRDRFRCMGSTQHVKSKYGSGYEIEIKVDLPTHEEVDSMLAAISVSRDKSLNTQEVSNLLNQLNANFLVNQISEAGWGATIFYEIKGKGFAHASAVAELVILETRGKALFEFLKREFPDVEMIEHFQSFFRYKISQGAVLSRIFSVLEDHKSELKIHQYAVLQTSIEAIFNKFAAHHHQKLQIPY
eukprot:TRINITY_DN1589_c0_g2_i3.p1 TRINITY_DN1589_c0_g2~~TRINITY_DN1589_c0_g2_i3.p1  ORF type:complete len:214 (-),score=51.15 TRINITY_DN1589_c0_g2_i3:258-821(-)